MTVSRALPAGLFIALLLAAFAGAYPNPHPATPAHAAALGGAALVRPEGTLPDPFSIQRVFLPPERGEAANRDAARGLFRKLPKDEFERLVQNAARVQQTLQSPSRILEAQYVASVRPGRVQGSASWRLIHPNAGAGAMPIDPLPGAVQSPAWPDGGAPILFRAVPDGKTLPTTFLWIDNPLRDRFVFDWSAQVVEQRDEERCTLTFPAAPISILELALSADRVPAVEQAGVLTTGPFPAPGGSERLWKLAFGGQTRLDLAFRKSQPGDGTEPASRAGRSVGWKLSGSEFAAQFDFVFTSTRLGGRGRTFLVDPGLEITGVTGGDVESWDWKAEGLRQLRVSLRAVTPTARISIRARVAPPTAAANWTPPQIRPANATLGGDTVEVQVQPDFKLEGWQPGDYRIGGTAVSPDLSTKLEFVPTLLGADDRTERRPPTIRLRPADRDFATVEALDWRVEPNRSKLTAAYSIRVLRGPIPSFSFQGTPGYRLESVTLTPDDPGATHGPLPGIANGWSVEPSRAAATGQSLDIRLEFREIAAGRGSSPLADGAELIPMPKAIPLGGGERRGVYSVRPIGGVKISTDGFGSPTAPLVGEPGFSISYRGREPDGDLLVSHALPAISARMETELAADGATVRAASTLSAKIEGTPVESLMVWVPGTNAQWQFEPSASAVRIVADPLFPWLPRLGSASPWSALALANLAEQPRGSLWRIAPNRPLIGDFTARVRWDIPRPAPDKTDWLFPMPHPFGVPLSDSAVKLDSALQREYRTPPADQTRASRSVTLIPIGSSPEPTAPPSDEWRFRDLRMTNRIESRDRIRCTLSGIVARPGAARLAIPLECEHLESVLLDGKPLDISRTALATSGLPIAGAGTAFEVQYTRRPDPVLSGIAHRAESPIPPLPGDPAIRSEWASAPEFDEFPSLRRDLFESDSPAVLVVADSTIRIGGWIVAILVIAGTGLFGLRNRWGVFATVALVFALGSACWLASDGWSSALRIPLAAAFARLAFVPISKPRRGAAIAVWAAGALTWAGAGQAQAPEPAIVFVIPGAAEHPDRSIVLAPKATLDKLAVLGRSPLPDAVITSADYDCSASGETVTVKAKYALTAVGPDEHALAIPLAGIRLEKATLDGREAFPDASKPDRYTIPIRGAGAHDLILEFAISVQASGIDREAKFVAPDIPVAHLGFAAGLRGRQLDVPTRSGGQSFRLTTAGVRVEAELGGGKIVQLRWREGGASEGAKPAISVKEGAVWDLGDSENLLTAAWQCRLEGGTVTGLKLELPDGVFPSFVSVEATEGAMPGLGIRSWKAGAPAGGITPVEVRFQNPVEGRFTLLLKGYSAKLPAVRPVLLFPKMAGVAEADRDSFHVVRIAGFRSDGIAVAGAIDFPAEAVTREFPKIPEFNFGKSPPARVVQRALGKATELRPVLLPTPAYQPLSGEAIYTVGRRIEVEGAMRLGAGASGTAEFDVPVGLILRDVRSPDLAGWSRSGSRIQVRFAKPVAEAIVRWSGQLPAAPSGSDVCELPLPRWPSAAAKLAEPIAVRVRPAPGWSIAPVAGAGWKIGAGSTPDEWLIAAEPEQIPTAKFSAKPLPKPDVTPGRVVPLPPTKPMPENPPGAPTADPPAPATLGERSSALPYRAGIWFALGLILVLPILRGSPRWRPEVAAVLGLGAVAVLGAGSILALPFWLLVGAAILVRALHLTRRILRSAFA